MSNLQTQIKRIKNHFTPEELKNMFIKRLDDDLFVELAKIECGRSAKDVEPHVLAFRGAELLGAITPPKELS